MSVLTDTPRLKEGETLLRQICEHILNYFADPKEAIPGTFTLAGGSISPALPVNNGYCFYVLST